MGEDANYNGQRIKIGTCENMYYLRADQVGLVRPLRGSVDPVRDRAAIRFRFPWPDEDDVEPGDFEKYERQLGLYGVEPPTTGIDHYSRQFTTDGYVVSLPCPETPAGKALGVHRNGNPGPVRIVQQKWLGDKLVLIAECGGCGSKYRLETIEDARPYIDAVRKLADGCRRTNDDSRAAWYSAIADRIEAGYLGRFGTPRE